MTMKLLKSTLALAVMALPMGINANELSAEETENQPKQYSGLWCGHQPINAQLSLYNNIVTPDDYVPEWQVRTQIQFMFPK